MSSSPHEQPPPDGLKARFSAWFWRLTPNCREVVRLTSEGRDRALPLGLRIRLGVHRRFCAWCARYAKQLDLIHEATHRLPEHAGGFGGPSLHSEAKERLKRALRSRAAEDA